VPFISYRQLFRTACSVRIPICRAISTFDADAGFDNQREFRGAASENGDVFLATSLWG
jgi:hypothetical protein